MSSQPFDNYKNKGVEYDFILNADVKVDKISDTAISEIISLLNNEDFLAMYFTKIALGRVYAKVEYLNSKLHFVFGISLIDSKERPTSKDLQDNIVDFILSLNKNLTDTLDNKIKEEDIKVDIITENKNTFDNIDKVLVSENSLYFTRGTNTQQFKLTDDGIVERYINESLQSTFPFSKLGLVRECKSLVTDGYTLTLKTEAEITSNTATGNNEGDKLDISNPEQTKQDLQQNIKDVEEIQDLKDELDSKVNDLMQESKTTEPFPSSEFTIEPLYYDEIDVDKFNENLTSEQKAYISAYICTIDEFVKALQLLYEEVGDTTYPMISIDDYIIEVQNYDGGIEEWKQELSDMLGLDLKTESKSKFYTADKIFDDFLKTANEESKDGGYTFKLSDLGLTKEDSAEFKNLLLQRDEIENVEYDPQNNTYTVKVVDVKSETDKPEESDNKEEKTEGYAYETARGKSEYENNLQQCVDRLDRFEFILRHQDKGYKDTVYDPEWSNDFTNRQSQYMSDLKSDKCIKDWISRLQNVTTEEDKALGVNDYSRFKTIKMLKQIIVDKYGEEKAETILSESKKVTGIWDRKDVKSFIRDIARVTAELIQETGISANVEMPRNGKLSHDNSVISYELPFSNIEDPIGFSEKLDDRLYDLLGGDSTVQKVQCVPEKKNGKDLFTLTLIGPDIVAQSKGAKGIWNPILNKKTENKNDDIAILATKIYENVIDSADMSDWFGEIQDDENDIYGEIYKALESGNKEQIENVIPKVDDQDLVDEMRTYIINK